MALASSRLPGGSWPPLLLATAIIVFIVWDPPLAHGGKSEYGKRIAVTYVAVEMNRVGDCNFVTTICSKIWTGMTFIRVGKSVGHSPTISQQDS